jgi:hypothetical protein
MDLLPPWQWTFCHPGNGPFATLAIELLLLSFATLAIELLPPRQWTYCQIQWPLAC